jgi:hypothetical protein
MVFQYSALDIYCKRKRSNRSSLCETGVWCRSFPDDAYPTSSLLAGVSQLPRGAGGRCAGAPQCQQGPALGRVLHRYGPASLTMSLVILVKPNGTKGRSTAKSQGARSGFGGWAGPPAWPTRAGPPPRPAYMLEARHQNPNTKGSLVQGRRGHCRSLLEDGESTTPPPPLDASRRPPSSRTHVCGGVCVSWGVRARGCAFVEVGADLCGVRTARADRHLQGHSFFTGCLASHPNWTECPASEEQPGCWSKTAGRRRGRIYAGTWRRWQQQQQQEASWRASV